MRWLVAMLVACTPISSVYPVTPAVAAASTYQIAGGAAFVVDARHLVTAQAACQPGTLFVRRHDELLVAVLAVAASHGLCLVRTMATHEITVSDGITHHHDADHPELGRPLIIADSMPQIGSSVAYVDGHGEAHAGRRTARTAISVDWSHTAAGAPVVSLDRSSREPHFGVLGVVSGQLDGGVRIVPLGALRRFLAAECIAYRVEPHLGGNAAFPDPSDLDVELGDDTDLRDDFWRDLEREPHGCP